MVENHPSFPCPADDTRIWRFMPLSKLTSILHRKAIFFARLDTFADDPFEGSVPRKTAAARNQSIDDAKRARLADLEAILKNVKAQGRIPMGVEEYYSFVQSHDPKVGWESLYRDQRTWSAVTCWHINQHESAGLCSLYAGTGQGVAIRTTIGGLKAALAVDPTPVYVGAVRYIDYEEDEPVLSNSFDPFVYKRKSFAHEAELRALVSYLAEGAGGRPHPLTESPGVYLSVHIAELIQAVHVAPGSPQWQKDAVEATLSALGCHAPVVNSLLDGSPVY